MRGILIFILFIFTISFVSADLVVPGYSPISIQNVITNVDDYPGYIFFSSGMDSIGPEMCPALPLAEGGVIQTAYKFCKYDVYATKKENKEKLNKIFRMEKENNFEEAYSEFKYLEKIKVIENVEHYLELPDSDPNRFKRNEYEVSLEKLPLKKATNISPSKPSRYIYFIISILALIGIIIILFKRKNKK